MSGFYDNLGGYEAKPLEEVATPHANRQNLSQPYNGRDIQDKVDKSVTESEQKSSAKNEFWLFFTRQQTKNVVAVGINHQFDRNSFNGDNYTEQRQRYIDLYNKTIKG